MLTKRALTRKCLCSKTCSTSNSSQSLIKNHHNHILISLWWVAPPQKGGKNIITRPIGIDVNQPHQMGHESNDLGEQEKIIAPSISKLKGCAHTNKVEKNPNGKL